MSSSLAQLYSHIENASLSKPAVSSWSVGMHIHHCALAIQRVCKGLLESTPPAPPTSFSLIRTIVFFTGKIPRGRGKAPEPTLPNTDIAQTELRSHLDGAEQLLEQVKQTDSEKWFLHHVFGVLDRNQTLKFLEIHNRHHLRIIEDIER